MVTEDLKHTMTDKKRVCIIGAGPCGMSALYQFDHLADPAVELVCYEKADDWAGLWNFTWLTGTDGYGEPCNGGQYRYLWSNGPKECLEYPDYTFEDHFGKAIPSFPPRPVIRDYLEGRFTKKAKSDLKTNIQFHTVVRSLRYNDKTDDFTVTVEDLKSRHVSDKKFTHVICATGIFSFPNKPTFNGIETFPGRIIHAHDFRDAREFKGQRILVVGSSFSAEDITLQCMKFGAESIVTSYRTRPMNFKFPAGVEHKPLVTSIDKNSISFKDGSSAEVDAIILCTGYMYHFPYLDDSLRLQSNLNVYPSGLYKGTLWLKGGNNKVFYMGVQDQYYTFTMFDVQALWICKFITGRIQGEPKSSAEMEADEQKWVKLRQEIKDCHGDIDVQSDYLADLCSATGYNDGIAKGRELFHKWEHDKIIDIIRYRDEQFTSIFTGNKAPEHTPWYEDYDDSIEAFIN